MPSQVKVIADLQIHSRFARAVSKQMTVPVIAEWAAKKGIGIIATGDWTHPLWFRELQANLVEAGQGVYKYRNFQFSNPDFQDEPLFLLSTEVSSIYSQGGKVRRIHTLIFAPDFQVVEKINHELVLRGANLMSDGRPIVGLTAKQVAKIALSVDNRCLIIPAHAWTPHFSLYGSVSGFDSIEECFGEISSQIYAIETGLSSDPAMNWRIEELKNRKVVSFSDAHSPQKMGREATVFEMPEVSYENVRKAIVKTSAIRGQLSAGTDDRRPTAESRILYTIEFYPEEGKYHYTGHRNCKVVYSPNETRKMGTACPVCGRLLTVGVMSRVEELAHGNEVETESTTDELGVRWIHPKEKNRPPYAMMVPLLEILAEALESGVGTQKVISNYELLINNYGGEFKVLLETKISEIERAAGPKVAEAISKVRSGDITIEPGYDGVFGKVKIWKEAEQKLMSEEVKQEVLF